MACRNYRTSATSQPTMQPAHDRYKMTISRLTVVESGGHDVPARDVRRRFGRTLGNLFKLYRLLLDTLHFFDNSSEVPRLIFKDEAGQTTINNGALCERLRQEFAP